jgi:molybdopterin synthase sulfur carrier subunit
LRVVLKLYASLTDYLPQKGRDQRHEVDLDVASDATVASVIDAYNLPPKQVHLVLVNGLYIEPRARPTRTLREGDHLAIWPPVAGG